MMKHTKPELKHCPMCGRGEPTVQLATNVEIRGGNEADGLSYAVNCDFNKGGCGTTGGYRLIIEEAINLWNTRRRRGNK